MGTTRIYTVVMAMAFSGRNFIPCQNKPKSTSQAILSTLLLQNSGNLKTNKGTFPDPVENLKSLIPKISDRIIMLQLLLSLMIIWHSSHFLLKTTQHMKNISYVHRKKTVMNP
jgi:hypothetical protein